jgi:hypothetical protein
MAYQTRLMTSLVALTAAGVLLAACDQRQAASVPPIDSFETSMGLDSGPPPPMAYGPAGDALEPGQPLRVTALGPAPERYRYIDDAYEMVDSFGDSPPDYAFDYGGVEPWVWRSGGGYYRVVEAIPDGYREYYYGPQDDTPFLVRDPRYSYAYDGGALVAVYDIYGRGQSAGFVSRQADPAARYYARARTLHYAALHQERRQPYADQWRARQNALEAPHHRWAQERERDPEWRRLREQRPAVQQATWSQERQQRQAQVTRLAEQPRKPDRSTPQVHGERGVPPPPTRVVRDERRDQVRSPAEARGQPQSAEGPRRAQRGEAAQQQAAQASAREASRAQGEQRQLGRQQAERDRGQARQAQAQVERQRGEARQARQQHEQAQAKPAQQAQAQQPRREERAQPAPRQERPQRAETPKAQTPDAQAHGRPAAARQQAAPAQRGGPKGGDKGGDKPDRR